MAGRNPFRIVIAEPFTDEMTDRLREFCEVTVLSDSSPESMIGALPGAHALLVRSKAHVTARIIDAGTDLLVIARAAPSVDHVDLRAAKRRDIPVVYCPLAAVESTAEYALAMMLSLHRRLHYFDQQVRDGRYENVRQPEGRELKRLVIGLLGLDPVAIRLAAMISAAFGSRLISHDPFEDGSPATGIQAVSLERLLAEADILSVHLRVTPQTRGLLNADRIRQMKPGAIIVNVTRGAVIDSNALCAALTERRIGGAALDVFETEPLPLHHPLRRVANCILTPHVAGATLDAADERYNVADDVIRVLSGAKPLHAAIIP